MKYIGPESGDNFFIENVTQPKTSSKGCTSWIKIWSDPEIIYTSYVDIKRIEFKFELY